MTGSQLRAVGANGNSGGYVVPLEWVTVGVTCDTLTVRHIAPYRLISERTAWHKRSNWDRAPGRGT